MEISSLVDSFEALFAPNKRIYWLYILSSLIIAAIYLRVYKKEQRVNLNKKLWLHPSAVLDYKYFIVSFFIKTLLIVPLLFGAKEVTMFVYEYLMDNYGFVKVTAFSQTQVMILYTVTLFVVSDFTRYWVHRFLHTIPFLWEFHKVHHSAKVLNPLTFYRVHPVENILFGLRYALSIGVVSGVFIYFFGAFIGVVEIIGVNLLLFIFSLMGSNLRHSHIKLGYPKLLENIFISPHQHQIHHSTRYTHKNFGGYLAVWDKVFGSLEYSVNVKKINLGLKTKEYDSIFSLFFKPFEKWLLFVRYLKTTKSNSNNNYQ